MTPTNSETRTDIALRSPTSLPAFAVFDHEPQALRALVRDTLGGAIALGDLDKIKMPSGQALAFTVATPTGEETCRDLLGVVLHVQRRRAYWPALYSGAGTPPDCASPDGLVGVGDPGGPCALCPLARFADGPPACRETADVAFLAPGDLLPTVLVVSPASLRPFFKYVLGLTKKGLRCADVVTRFGLERATSQSGIVYPRGTYTMAAVLDESQRARLRALVAALAFDAPAAQGTPHRPEPAGVTPATEDIPPYATMDLTEDSDTAPVAADDDSGIPF